MTLSRDQKLLLAGGAAVVLLVVLLKFRSSSASAPPAATVVTGSTSGTGSAIGTGQLANFESSLTEQQNAFLQQLSSELSSGSTTTTQQPSPSSSPSPPPPLNPALFPTTLPSTSNVLVLGATTGPGGLYSGEDVIPGAPVFALINGQWRQGWNPQALPPGTPLATLPDLKSYVAGSVTNVELHP